MIAIQFLVPETFIAYYALTGTQKSFFANGEFVPDIITMQNAAERLDKSACELIKEGYLAQLYMESQIKEHKLSAECRRIDKLLELLLKEPAYAKLLRQTNDSLVEIRQSWEGSIPKLQDLSELLLDGKEKYEQKVFVSLPALNLNREYYGDIYIVADESSPYANSLNLWELITEVLVKPAPADPADQWGEGNQIWVNELLKELIKFEAKSRLSGDLSHEHLPEKYRRDFDVLKPMFFSYLKSPGNLKLREFRNQAMEKLVKVWAERKSTK